MRADLLEQEQKIARILHALSVDTGRPNNQKNMNTADANNDTFQCENCGHIRDIDDSIKQPDGELFCDDCSAKTQ